MGGISREASLLLERVIEALEQVVQDRCEAAQLIVASSRSFSVVTRYGGDEFAVLLVNTPKSGAVKYARRIKDVIERHRFVHGPLTVSVGIAALPEDVTASDDLVPAADRALYTAKRSGRNLIEIA